MVTVNKTEKILFNYKFEHMLKHLLFTLCLMCLSMGISAQTSVGIIGTATPTGWDSDTDMTLINEMDSIWSIDITLFDGVVKFRADDDWIINWGSLDFPAGIGEQDGNDIPVFAGDYTITLNTITGEYFFDVDSDIGIIGDATPGGWDDDSDMFKDQTDPNKFFTMIDLTVGEVKFRKDDDWAVNWGGPDFPSGVATLEGENIPVDAAAPYFVTLDTLTGEYSFESMVTYTTVGIIGDATPGGWDDDTDMTQDANNPNLWTIVMPLLDGEVKFRAEDAWDVNWGATDFPIGVGLMGGDNIPVVAGDYFISFNSETGDYEFRQIVEYASVGIIGDATPGGWDSDTDLTQDADDPHLWTIRMDLLDGEVKFRAENDWAVNWGSGDFPAGTAVQDGANIPVVAGDYRITFNSLSGAYDFTALVEYGTVGLIGVSGPVGDWETDTPLTKDADDFNIWTMSSVTLVDFDPDADGGVKFRAENDWAVNWGLADFPSGVATQDGPNIEPVGGTYSVWFNSGTGEYIFGDVTSTHEVVSPQSINVYPNPVVKELNIDFQDVELTGQVSLKIRDMGGKLVKSITMDAAAINAVDVSELQTGQYFLQIQSSSYMIGKRFSVVK